jgi:hypothetical protein
MRFMMRKKSFDDLLGEISGEMGGLGGLLGQFLGGDDGAAEESGDPLVDNSDVEILMHRDSHFGGKFSVMIEYYDEEKKGVQEDFDVDHIKYMASLEEKLETNLSTKLLTGPDAEKVGKSRDIYKKLKALYEIPQEQEKSPIPRIIADLILSEEEEPEEERNAVSAQGKAALPHLLKILKQDFFLDPLFPGYGYAPIHVIECIGEIKGKEAVPVLFEMLGTQNENDDVFDIEQAAIEALSKIGPPSKTFLLKMIKGRPITRDNHKAAMALEGCFSSDAKVALTCFQQLHDDDVFADVSFLSFLILNCAALEPQTREKFIAWSRKPSIPQDVRLEIESVISDWEDEE